MNASHCPRWFSRARRENAGWNECRVPGLKPEISKESPLTPTAHKVARRVDAVDGVVPIKTNGVCEHPFRTGRFDASPGSVAYRNVKSML